MITFNIGSGLSDRRAICVSLEFDYSLSEIHKHIERVKLYRKLTRKKDMLRTDSRNDRQEIAHLWNRFVREPEQEELDPAYKDDYKLPDSFVKAYNEQYIKNMIFTSMDRFVITLDQYFNNYVEIKEHMDNGYLKIKNLY
jgi:hypothetical protein